MSATCNRFSTQSPHADGATVADAKAVGDLVGPPRKTKRCRFAETPLVLVGVVGFAAASALGGAANGFTMLVVARALQGAFGALLAPAALSLLNTTFTDTRERARAFSVYDAIAGAGGAVGLLLGGVLTDALDWRWTLYVNVAIAVVAFVGGWVLLGNHRDAANAKLDVPGTVLVAAGLFSPAAHPARP